MPSEIMDNQAARHLKEIYGMTLRNEELIRVVLKRVNEVSEFLEAHISGD
jgi:hypothetical protein